MDATTWRQVGALFDELAALPPAVRPEHPGLDAAGPEIRQRLDCLLAAHDAPDESILDRSLDDIVRCLTADAGINLGKIPERLAGRRFGNWRAVREIARGGMGVVLLGERADGQFEMQAAIKVLPPGPFSQRQAERLRDEIRILARLTHPNIARLIDGGITDDGIPYLVMEYVRGMALIRYCEERRLAVRQRIELLCAAAEAVAHAHRHLVVHNDIKPANVLVTDEGLVKLLDFGIAGLLTTEHEAGRPAALLRCTPAYAAPEQFVTGGPATTHDVYGLGALLYEMLSGRRLRDGRDTISLLLGREHATGVAMPPSDCVRDRRLARHLKGDLDVICRQALAADPERRYPTAAAMLTDLQNWLALKPVAARGGGRMYRAGKWFRRHRVAAAAGGLAMMSLLTGAAVAVWQAERATAALAQTTVALQRATKLRDFLLELFRAAAADRPRDQLPDTEELLELGAQRALDPSTAADDDRFGMLTTIGEVYLSLNRVEQARPLIDQAVMIAIDPNQQRPADLAYALRQQGWLAMKERRLDDAERSLLEAESALGIPPAPWKSFAAIRAIRGYLEIMRGDNTRALAILEPLYRQMQQRQAEQVDDRLRYNVLNPLAIAYRLAGKLEPASSLNREIVPTVRRLYGTESLRYAVTLANSASIEIDLGHFADAEHHLGEALALYDRIFTGPAEYRAAARHLQARLLLYRGDYEKALHEMSVSSTEWARASGKEAADYDFFHINQGMLLTRMHRWPEAVAALETARRLLDQQGKTDNETRTHVEALLALSHCMLGDAPAGISILADLERRLNGRLPTSAEYRARLHEARAGCQSRVGQPAAALSEIDLALAAVTQPGRAVEIADCKILRAAALTALGRRIDAQNELVEAETLLLDLNLTEHPALQNIAAARRDLSAS